MVFCLEFVWLLVPVTEHYVREPMGSYDLGYHGPLLLAELGVLLTWWPVGSKDHDTGPSRSNDPSCPVVAVVVLVRSPGCSQRVTNQLLSNHRPSTACGSLGVSCADRWGKGCTIAPFVPCLKGLFKLSAL